MSRQRKFASLIGLGLCVLSSWCLLILCPMLFGDLRANDELPQNDAKNFVIQPPFGGGRPFGPPGGQERKLLEQFDKNGDGWLNKQERDEARTFLFLSGGSGRGGFSGPPGRGPGGFGPPDRGPGGLGGPENLLLELLIAKLDTNSDKEISPKELKAGIERWFAKTKNGLDAEKLAEAINSAMPQPKDFPGGSGGPPQGFGPGTFLAPALISAVDQDNDKRVSMKEAVDLALKQFAKQDKDKSNSLQEEELRVAMAEILPPPPGFGGPRRGGPGRGGPGGFGRGEPGRPGPKVSPNAVETYPDAELYDPKIIRTIFLDFETKDWEQELEDFHGSDVDVPVTMVVDGKTYKNVGVHFRGMSSYMSVSAGSKRSLNLDINLVNKKQRLYGHRTLNLLNSHSDPTFLHSVLFAQIANQYIPSPRANFVKVVINGESWGIYVNAEQFNKDFLKANYKSAKGVRWKVKGSPGGRGGLEYLGDDIEPYQQRYQMTSDDGDKAWNDLANLCKVLNTTPLDRLEKELEPILDIEGALWFLALDVALMNGDGYWVRASDYTIFRDQKGKFHLIPHDTNETFSAGGGPGFGRGGFGGRGGRGGSPFELDPLVAMNDATKPLRSKLLAVPALRQRYLEHVRTIARDWLDWNKLGPMVAQYRELIEPEIKKDTRKLSSYDAFLSLTADTVAGGNTGGRGGMSLRAFAEGRRDYLLNHPEIKKLK